MGISAGSSIGDPAVKPGEPRPPFGLLHLLQEKWKYDDRKQVSFTWYFPRTKDTMSPWPGPKTFDIHYSASFTNTTPLQNKLTHFPTGANFRFAVTSVFVLSKKRRIFDIQLLGITYCVEDPYPDNILHHGSRATSPRFERLPGKCLRPNSVW